MKGFGNPKAYFDDSQMVNLLSFSHLADKFRITVDTSVKDCVNVHTDEGIVKFKRLPEGLYGFDPTSVSDRALSCLVRTVEENKIGFTKREIGDAMKARNLYHNLGCPTVENMKSLLRSNAIQDCPVTAEHVTNAEAIFGPDIGTLKGKTTHRKPRIVTQDVIAIPPEI